MPQNPAAALGALLRSATIEDHEEILRAANAALKSNRNDEAAQHTRVVALLKLDRFDDASRAIAEGGVKLETKCALEKAYALYKQGLLDEAFQALSSSGLQDRGLSHLAAQVAYRAENFEEAQSVYHRLLAENPHEENNDLNINLKAAEAQAEWKGLPSAGNIDPSGALDTFELCYNAACVQIAHGSFEKAQNLLQRALALCDASDDLSDEDKADERRSILAQQIYVSAKLGNVEEAIKSYNSIDIPRNEDQDFNIVVENNRAALNAKPKNPYIMERQVARWMSNSEKAKLFNFQSTILATNSSVVDLHANKLNAIKKRARAISGSTGSTSTKPDLNVSSVLGAAAEVHGLAAKDALRSLQGLSKKRPEDVGLTLTIVQLLLEQERLGAALHVLEQFMSKLDASHNEKAQSVRFCPGLVALAVALKKLQKRETSAKTELTKAAEYWRDRPANPAASLLREAGLELAKSSNVADLELAGVTVQKLHDENVASEATSAALVASLATTDLSKVEHNIGKLPSCSDLVGNIDIEHLVKAGVATLEGTDQPSKKRRIVGDQSGDHAAKKRRRTRLPKNMVEGQKVDPERWLPLRDRSSYKPKGKKGKKKAAEVTQGGMVKDEETIGLVGGGGVKVEKAASSNPNKKKKKSKK